MSVIRTLSAAERGGLRTISVLSSTFRVALYRIWTRTLEQLATIQTHRRPLQRQQLDSPQEN